MTRVPPTPLLVPFVGATRRPRYSDGSPVDGLSMEKRSFRREVFKASQHDDDWPAAGVPLSQFVDWACRIFREEPAAHIRIDTDTDTDFDLATILIEVIEEETDENFEARLQAELEAQRRYAEHTTFVERQQLTYLRAKYEGAPGSWCELAPDEEGQLRCPRCDLSPAQDVEFNQGRILWRCEACNLRGNVAARTPKEISK